MKVRVWILCAAVLVSLSAWGMFARFDDAGLIAASDVIAEGVLIGTTTLVVDGRSHVVGVLQLRSTLKGGPADVLLIALPGTDAPRSSSDVRLPTGADGVWLLRAAPGEPGGLYAADHPQRFVPAADVQRISELRAAVANTSR